MIDDVFAKRDTHQYKTCTVMKNYILSLILVIFIFSSNAMAQYEKGAIDFNLGGGIGVYGAKSNDAADSSGGIGAANNLWNLTVNYAIIPELSIGYTFERNGFLGQNSDSSSNGGYANSNNFKLNVVFRMMNKEKNAFSLQSAIGLSKLKFGDNSGQEITSSGMTYEFGLTYQHLFGEHFGYYLNGSYSAYRYAKIMDQDGDVWQTNDGAQDVILTLSGGTLRLGLVYRM